MQDKLNNNFKKPSQHGRINMHKCNNYDGGSVLPRNGEFKKNV
jgi:hypothetical protein